MEEILLTNKKHGMRTLVIFVFLELLTLAGAIALHKSGLKDLTL